VRSRGFSLLEALVTLVIIALVATVLMQSLLYVLGMRERVLRIDRDARTSALHERWFRDSVGAAVADRVDGASPFVGDASSVRFLSQSPVTGEGVWPIAWRLDRADEGPRSLTYAQGADAWRVLPPALLDARFDYLDHRGVWHATWPVESRPEEALPRAVRLVASRDGRPLLWWVTIAAGPRLPPSLQFQEEAPGADL
jgi:prepilin-type N-terminal cleavage/methylation domain-containing protein